MRGNRGVKHAYLGSPIRDSHRNESPGAPPSPCRNADPEALDAVLSSLEAALLKLEAPETGIVERRKNEQLLMKSLEGARDIMEGYLLGKNRDLSLLESVFCGDDDRLSRIRFVFQSASKLEAIVDDQRFQSCFQSHENLHQALGQFHSDHSEWGDLMRNRKTVTRGALESLAATSRSPFRLDQQLDDMETAIRCVKESRDDSGPLLRLRTSLDNFLTAVKTSLANLDEGDINKTQFCTMFAGQPSRVARARTLLITLEVDAGAVDKELVSRCLQACESVEQLLDKLGWGPNQPLRNSEKLRKLEHAELLAAATQNTPDAPDNQSRAIDAALQTIQIGRSNATVTADVGIDVSKVLEAQKFRDWVDTIAMERRIEVSKIHIQSVDLFGKNVGFVKFSTEARVDGRLIPGIVLMRGGAVAILVILYHKGSQFTLIVRQPRVPVCCGSLAEIPAGMIDEDGNFAGVAAKEMNEETGLQLREDDLIDMSYLAFKNLYPGMLPSCEASDEFNRIFLYQKAVSAEELANLNGKLTGVIEEGERIKLQIIPLEALWRVSADAKALAALCLYKKLYSAGLIAKAPFEHVENVITDNGVTPLMAHAAMGKADLVELCLEARLNVNQKDIVFGHTALMSSAAAGHVECTRLLLTHDASVHEKDKLGLTAFLSSVRAGHSQVAQMLLESQASLGDRDHLFGRTALMLAAHCGHLGVMQLLLRASAPVDEADSANGTTPLMWGTLANKLDVVRKLLMARAHIDASDQRGRSGLSFAELHHRNEISSFLSECRAKDR